MGSPSDERDGNVPPGPREALALQLEAAEARLLIVLGLTEGIVFEFDPEGRYLAVWTRSDELLAAPREQLLGRTLAEVLGPQAAAPFVERIQRTLATGKSEHFEYSLDVEGGLRWFSADSLPMPHGQSAAFLVRDITRHKEMEQRLLQADRLAALGTLAAGVAHEVSNPMSYVSSNLNFALEELSGLIRTLRSGTPDPSLLESVVRETVEALSGAREGVARIRHVVGDLKTFARGGDTSCGTADVKRALEASLGMAAMELRHKARLEQHLEDTPPVRGSEARLGQVFLNLLLNAAQAITRGTREENRVELRLRAEPPWVVVEIEDTGAGIPPELLKRIFDPFFSTKPAGVGTGLGLSICHGLVTEMGGEITVKSTLGQGTCFRVRLPMA